MTITRDFAPVLVPVFALFTIACGDDSGSMSPDGGTPGEDGGGPSTSVEEVLTAFGVDISMTPRVGDDGEALPDTYSPLGSRRTINRFGEIMLFGVQMTDAAEIASTGSMPIIDIAPGAGATLDASLLHDQAPADAPWLLPSIPRGAESGDFDGDGMDEVAIAYQETPTSVVNLVVMQNAAESYTVSAPQVIDTTTGVYQLFLAAADFDGNATVDLAVGITAPTLDHRIFVLGNTDGAFAPTGQEIVVPRVDAARDAQLALATGNIDYDNAMELGLVVNEYGGDVLRGTNFSEAASRYFVYDDGATDFTVLESGPTIITADMIPTVATVGNIAFGDVDGDNVDEVLLGGLDRIGNTSGGAPRYLLEVIDDARRGFASLAGNVVDSELATLMPSASGATQIMTYLHVLAADVDGDGAKEIVTNQFVYDDLRVTGGALVPFDDGRGVARLPLKELFTDGDAGDDFYFSWASSSMVAGDVTSDTREDVVIYSQRQDVNGETQELQVWGLDQIEGWREHVDIETSFANYQNPYRAQVLLPDLAMDNESMALEYSAGSYRLVFTEPILLAVLAAAPCSTTLGQDLGESCRTAFGQGIGDTMEDTNAWSFVVGVSVGFDGTVPFVGGPEAILNTRNTLRYYSSSAYTLTKRVFRETGAIEDSVIFGSIPLDIYSYEVISHPNPDLIGEIIEVRLPREPVTVMVQREFYNAHIEEGAPRIDDAIFQHTEGDPSTYPTVAQRNAILHMYPGLQSEQFDVGQGTGQTIASIAEFTTTTEGSSLAFDAFLHLRATSGGVVGGYTVGGGADFALAITHGKETIYQGSVGNIAAENFPADAYSWGLFSYLYEDPGSGQTFEVLRFWVD